jgi:hypothetical protein
MIHKVQTTEDVTDLIGCVRQLPVESDFRIAALEYIHRATGWDIWDMLEEEDRWVLSNYLDFTSKKVSLP